jgi:predicted TIM-barrel fold metal-dependent hydrolase
MTSLPYIVSVDDHLIEPATLWESRLPEKLRERGPRAVETPEGVHFVMDGERVDYTLNIATAGQPLEERTRLTDLHWDDIRPGCYDPIERVKDMDLDGVVASLSFPSLPGFGGNKFNALEDKELGFACIRAYNDFQIEEWAAAAPGRLFAMVLVPYWDPQLAVQELQRTAAKGAVAVAFNENPNRQGFPSLHDHEYWDPVFSAAQEAEMPLCLHFGSSSYLITSAPDAPRMVRTAAAPLSSQLCCIDWIASGVFERFPGLQIVLSERFLGWIPFVIEECDHVWKQHFAWAIDREKLPRLPSEYFRQSISACLMYDEFGAEMIERIGVDRVLAESDYPHPDSQWPNTEKVLQGYLHHLSPDDRMKVLRTNAEKLFHLELALPAPALV